MTTNTVTSVKTLSRGGNLSKPVVWGIPLVGFVISFVLFGVLALGGGEYNVAGAVIIGTVLAMGGLYAISAFVEGTRKATDRFMTGMVIIAFSLAIIPLLSVIMTLVSKGLARFDLAFFTSTEDPLLLVQDIAPGAQHAIAGTLIMTLIATLISVPIGIFTSIYIVEYGTGWFKRAIGFFVDVMTGVPSIVAGLFAFAVFYQVALIMGSGFDNVMTGITGSIALAVLMIPTVVRSTEEMLRLVPDHLREATYALGVPKWITIVKIVLPTAIVGIITGVMLAIARVIGETAPLLIAAGAQYYFNANPAQGQMTSIPVYVFHASSDGQHPNEAWTGAFVLLLIVMILNLVARLVASIFAPKASR